jgi:pyruvate dehydrogenase E2 component (dihydrolipoamide acetyltransferase)
MATEIRMPALGQTTDELLILRWLKAEGESVRLNEPLLEVETDKATLEVESAAAGTLLRIVYGEGETLEVGTVIAYIGKVGEALPELQPASAGATSVVIAPTETPMITPPAGKVLATPVARLLAKQNQLDITQVRGTGPGGLIETRDVRALLERTEPAARMTPVARRMAAQNGVDVSQVRGSGVNGRIEKRDIESTLPSEMLAPEGAVDMPVPRHRQIIARRLVQSVTTIPQIRLTMTIHMQKARNLLTAQRAAGLDGLTYTHLILRAVAVALRAQPLMNRLWIDGEPPRYRQLPRPDVGLAIASEDNLLVATIPEPDRLTLTGLVRHANEAVERGRSGSLHQADMAPAALTVSNLGMYGIDDFQALVDPAQTAILAAGRVAEQVAVIDGGIHILPLMQVSLSVDHRVADGALAAQFLQAFREALENIEV